MPALLPTFLCANDHCPSSGQSALTVLVNLATIAAIVPWPNAIDVRRDQSVKRILLSVVSVGGLLFWLLGSYVPALSANLPQTNWGPTTQTLFAQLAAGALTLFCVLQLWLVADTARWFRSREGSALHLVLAEFRLKPGPELFWTLLPLLGTLTLALLLR